MKVIFPLFIIFILLQFPVLAKDNTYKFERAQVQTEVPQNWSIDEEKDEVRLLSPAADMCVLLDLFTFTTIEAAYHYISSELEKDYKNLELSESDKIKIFGMPYAYYSGKGTSEGLTMFIDIIFVKTPNQKVLMIYSIAEEDISNKYKNEFTKIIKGLKPLKL